MKPQVPLGFQSISFQEVVGQNGLAFLRKSHAGCNTPPAYCQEPAFESHSLFSAPHCLLLTRSFQEVVGQNGLEPSTSRLSVVCSSQLSYWPVSELLAILRYRADISVSGPHSKRFGSRPCLVVESTGIEPVTSCLQGRRSPS